MSDAVFVTGATGFVGRRVTSRLAARGDTEVVCLVRPGSEHRALDRGDTVRRVTGDLLEPGTYEPELARCHRVIHLAAATGRASRAGFRRVNVDGTAALVSACRRAGGPSLVHVSTIAVHFDNLDDYPYAASKAEAENVVRGSGLHHTIVRPTLVLGRGGPAWSTLSALARLPVVLLPGEGTAPVQPVHVGDLARVLGDLLDEPDLPEGPQDIGGPEAIPVRELVACIGRRLRGSEPRFVRLPLRPLTAAIRWLDRLLPFPPPVAPGQLSTFHQDGRVRDGILQERVQGSLMGVDEMIERCLGSGPEHGPDADGGRAEMSGRTESAAPGGGRDGDA